MMHARLNNSEACICCARRADGNAVGSPRRLGWFCFECGSATAWKVLHMVPENMDDIEQRACLKVAGKACREGWDDPLTISAAELPAFIAWCVKEFAEAMREDLKNGQS